MAETMLRESLRFDTSDANNLDAQTIVDSSAATPSNVKGNYLYKDAITRELKVGSMAINSSEDIKINPQIGQSTDFSYTIPEGYHTGTGTVYTGNLREYTPGTAEPKDVANNKVFWVNGERRVGTLDIDESSQTGTATASDLLDGKTAWVNHSKITGTIPVLPRRDRTLLAGESYTLPYGLSSGYDKVTAASLESQTQGDATADNIETGLTAWVNGERVVGQLDIPTRIRRDLSDTDALGYQVLSGKKFYSAQYGTITAGIMPDHTGEAEREIPIGESFMIPEGYYSGLTSIRTKSLRDATIGSATASNILYDKIAWVNGEEIIGTMEPVPAEETELDPGTTYNIPEGYHSGNGTVVTKSLAEMTQGTADAPNISQGKVAWVNGEKVIGTMTDNMPESIEVHPGETFYIPAGHHSGTGNVWTKSLAALTPGTAEPANLVNNKTAWVNGEEIVGTMQTIAPTTVNLDGGEEYTIPAGFHDGNGKVIATDLPDQTPGTAEADDILLSKTAWVNGEKLTGTLELTGDASAEDVISGKTFYNVDAKEKQTGTLALTGDAQADDVIKGATFYNNNVRRKITGTLELTGTATADKVLAGETFYNTDPRELAVGSMQDNGAVVIEAECGNSYPIPEGYHNGSGYVNVPPLSDQTRATAEVGDILEGKTAWVNGSKITGDLVLTGTATANDVLPGKTFYNTNAKSLVTGNMPVIEPPHVTLSAGSEYQIPTGFHGTEGTVTAQDLASQTEANATASDIVDGKSAWVNGERVDGTIPIIGTVAATLRCDEFINIAYGVHSGDGVILAASLASQTPGNATDSQILFERGAWVNGNYVLGSMPNVGTESKELLAGESHTISLGYHNGTGVISAASLASQTPGNALVSQLLEYKIAWVNGVRIEGQMPNIGSQSRQLLAGESQTISLGYHDGTGVISAASLASQTPGSAISDDILDTKTAWVNGSLVTGSMPNIGEETEELQAGESHNISLGFHDGTGVISAASLESQTQGTATGDDILSPKTAWVNGVQVTGTITTRETEVVRINAGNQLDLPSGFYPNGITIYCLYTDRLDLTGTDAYYYNNALYPESTGYVDGNQLVITAVPIG